MHDGIVEGSIEQVWVALTTSEGLRSWRAPHAEIDFGIGDVMWTNYNPQGRLGDPGTIENAILSFEPQRMLSVKVSKAPANFPFPNAIHEMWTVSYEIAAQIGVGSMGEAYRARDTTLSREVAIKTLPESLAADSDRSARLEREAKVLAALYPLHTLTASDTSSHQSLFPGVAYASEP